MVLKGFGVVVPRRGQPGGWIARPPKSNFFTTDRSPPELGKGEGKHKGKYRGLGKGKWAGWPTHAVAQSAVADILIWPILYRH